MNDLSLAQQYLLCVLKKNGKFPGIGIEKPLCFTASCVLELLMGDVLAFDGKKLRVQAPLPEEKAYLRPVHAMIQRKQPVKFETVVEAFSVTFTGKAMNALVDSVGESLVAAGCVQKETGGLFGGKKRYLPSASMVDAIVQNIRAEILEDGELSEDIVALSALLHKSGELKKYFSAYEKKDFRKRMQEIKESPQNEMIQKVMEYIDALLATIIIAST
mgnify:FL=1